MSATRFRACFTFGMAVCAFTAGYAVATHDWTGAVLCGLWSAIGGAAIVLAGGES